MTLPRGVTQTLSFDGVGPRRRYRLVRATDASDATYVWQIEEERADGTWRVVGTQDVTDAKVVVNSEIAHVIETVGRRTTL